MVLLHQKQTLLGLIVFLILLINEINTELTPPYFNLAEGRKIFASATCGVDTDGPELYCKLVGANTENDQYYSVIQGQVCDVCDPSSPDKTHPADYAIDGTENWWQSPPLSRGMKYNEVNLTIDFGQEFHVAYLFIRMGNSPRPGLWTLEKSSDYGKTWKPWQHFSDTPSDCETYFGRDSLRPIQNDDDVICTTEYSKIVPLENGEIPVMLLNNRPSANNYFNSSVLQEWTRATNVRIRLLRTKNLLGHLMSVARQDPTVTRRYFYSIKDISIGGRCVCNGHADTCHISETKTPNRILACRCQHNTCGVQCAECCPGFEQKKWHQNTNAHPFQCEPCNCFGHSNTCVYSEEIDEQGLSLDIHGNYEGGGICQNCQHNTEGINCNKCKSKYYRPYGRHWNETDVCQPCNCNYFYSTGNCEEGNGRCECRTEFQPPHCDACSYGHFGYPNCRPCECNLNGTEGYHCEAQGGKCPCKPNFFGDRCERCADGYYSLPECIACECNAIGSVNNVCNDNSGQCPCKPNFSGKHCEKCKDGYFDYPTCTYCNCDLHGTKEEVCNKNTGICLCKEGYGGPRCDQCLPGYYNYPECIPCNCSISGSASTVCDALGKCPCLSNFAGKQCSSCSAGYYQYPECLTCNCDTYGSIGISCNNDGQCQCNYNFDGKTCNQCKETFYNFPACEECNCDPAGVSAKFAGCSSVPAGELCQCKERVTGRICDSCKPLYWNLNITNPTGCEECDCFIDGTMGALDTCDSKSGQCACKPSVEGRICNECKDGSFDLYGGSLFGCKDCNCDIGGSHNSVCNKNSGQCKCHPRIAGRTCTQPLTTHYFPTLYQYQFEYEDGYKPTGAHVRYQFEEDLFPDFSKKGYAVFSNIQNEIINDVNIFKSSVYRLIIRFVNPTKENVVGQILITSDNPIEVDQHAKVLFKPTDEPQFVTVSGAKGEIPSPIVLDPGRYNISIKMDKPVFLDYFVLLPAAYYEATILTRKIENPCEVGYSGLCRHYTYPVITEYGPVSEAFLIEDSKVAKTREYFNDNDHLMVIREKNNSLPLISGTQMKLYYMLNVTQSGRYIIVVDYVTDKNNLDTTMLSVNQMGDDENDGVATLYQCTYTTICRQPVIDKEAREKVFFINAANKAPIEIIGDESGRIGIKSITAIPLDQWSLDYIQPSPVCVMQDGKCVQATFRAAPDSKKIEFEVDHEDDIAEITPVDMFDNTTKLIYLDNDNSLIEIKSKVSEPGRYVVLIKYFQPNHPNFNVLYKIDTDRQVYDGKFGVKNCPSNSGCRGMIKQDNGYMWFDIEEGLTLTLTNPTKKGIWIDYVLLVPADQFTESLLEEDTLDQTKEFIQKCGQDHFHIKLNASEFCKQAVFSLTADYNNGALPCTCDYSGSTSFECDPFGGQCQCKPNIIGRQCEACRTGYYGFPDCKPCDCPSTALCERETGECICPPRVTGEKCDQCMPYTFGFDQIIGCEDCNCNPIGVHNHNLQCDFNNGSCHCRPNVVGRSCDKCKNGFHSFPNCMPCRCDIRGTTYEICDQEDESCFCKKHVQGMACEACVEGTYNLQASNPEGCTKCFCFGKTTRCESAFLRLFNVSMMKDISINTISFKPNEAKISRWPYTPNEILLNDTTGKISLTEKDNDEGLIYFGVLEYWLDQNNHLSAYGGHLSYSIYYSTGLFGSAIIGPDIILEGKHMVITHQSYEQPANSQIFRGAVRMIESNFRTLSGGPVSREQFMVLLRDLNGIYIRATYWDETIASEVSDVYLTMADEDSEQFHLYEELPVEKCQCPPGYMGMSCEDCAPGYYRDPSGPHGGYCIPCQCNGHADTCNCDTGICNNCEHHTMGEHCDQCVEGYYGNATFGSPHDCMICACPIPIESNNFASSCEVSEDGYKIHCECKEGYAGAKCESCAAGFYGRPTIEGEICKPCECSGNINPEEPGACDTVTGECILCLNNTSGRACNLCAPGFYGDAVVMKDCQTCICDTLGTYFCDSFNGTCQCQDNVIGEKCDRCKVDHYGFDSGFGCNSCDCGIASNSTQCDDHTGECRCKPGVTGRQCDRCLPGYWNYTSSGCIPCSCNTDYSRGLGCNALTGQCECLPGVVGEKCDACPYRWVLIPDSGCRECDHCHHALLDVTDALKLELDPVIHDFDTVASGYFTSQKLNYFIDLVNKIDPEVKALDPQGVNLTPIRQEVETLEMDIKNLDRKLSYAVQNAEDIVDKGLKLLNDSNKVLDTSRLVQNDVRNTIDDVQKLAESLDSAESTKVDKAFKEADDTLAEINNHVVEATGVIEQLQKVYELLEDIEKFKQPVKSQNESLVELSKNIKDFNDTLKSLFEWSSQANNMNNEAELLNTKNKFATVTSKFDTAANQAKEAQNNIQDGQEMLKNTSNIFNNIIIKYNELEATSFDIKTLNDKVDKLLPKKEEDYNKLTHITQAAQVNAFTLDAAAEDLKGQLTNIATNSETALKAATAYTNIVDAVRDAKKSVQTAKFTAGNATELTNGIEDRAQKSDQYSIQMLDEARTALSSVQTELQPRLIKSSTAVNAIQGMNTKSDDQNSAINSSLDHMSVDTQTDIWENAKNEAIDAQEQAKEALKILKPVVTQIPSDLDKAKQMPKEVDQTNKDIAQASNQVERVNAIIPNLKELVDDLAQKQDSVSLDHSDLGDKIGQLRKQIEIARDLANSIKVGVTFHPNTTLELKPPANLQQLSTNSRVSAFFKTDKPNGFLFYLGNENKTSQKRNKRDDFMALEVENGYPVLTIDLGNGPERLILNKFVADDKWHQAIVERTGNNVKLIVREELEDGTEDFQESEAALQGSYSVFNVDQDSKLFVGGYPPDFNIQAPIRFSSFEGQIEDLRIGDAEVGLWNFVDAVNNAGGAERDKMLSKETPTTGYRFSGNGYVILDSKPYSFKQRSSIQFKFKAGKETNDGLMFYAGKHRHFISVEMRNGGIYFQYKLGQHIVSIGANEQFNDDQWHRVEAERDGRKGLLKIDNKVIYQEESPLGSEENLKISETMYFGGHPSKINHSEVVSKSFDGCIDDVFIAGTPVDLSRHLKGYGVRPGCPSKFSSILAYPPRQFGYLRRPNANANNHFQVNLKFRTKQKEGIIFYATTPDQSSTIGLAINNGSLVFQSMKEELSTGKNKYNNGEWHVVTAIHDIKTLRLSVDDFDHYTSEFQPPELHITNGDIYFGGLPKGYIAVQGALPTTAYFTGCISDVTINGHIVNFANSTDRLSAVLDNCPRDILDYDVKTLPIFYPEDDVQPIVAVTNEDVYEQEKPKDHMNEIFTSPRFGLDDREEGDDDESETQPSKIDNEVDIDDDFFPEQSAPDSTRKPIEVEERPTRPTPTTTSTTVMPKTTRRRPAPENRTEPICKLPIEPDVDVDFDAGYRFGTSEYSRIEFNQIGKTKKAYDFSLQFKTDEPDGVLFYAADNRHTDFIALYLRDGKVYHSFNCGSGSANMSSKFEYNDNQWHTVLFSRQQTKGKLVVDDDDESLGESIGNTRTMAVQAPIYVGGVNQEALEDVNLNLKAEKGSYFKGCIKNIQMTGRPLGEPSSAVGVLPCSEQVEKGVFFGKGGGYVKLREKFFVGAEMTISLDIKPRTMDGLLLSVHGKKAFLILQLYNGAINFTVDNGDSVPITTIFKPDNNENFCDGQWRTIKAIKSQYVITIQVNKMITEPSIGSASSPITNTNRPLFLGGHPHLPKIRGLMARKPYFGCIRNVKIHNDIENIQPGMTVGNVQTGVCPTN